jgi:Tol biopolymer transport system component
LEKKAADRWQSAEELLPQLESLATPSGGITPTGTMPVDRVSKRTSIVVGAAVGVAAIVVMAVLVPRLLAPSPITVTTSNITRVTRDVGIEFQPAISPDGEEVAYVDGFVGPIGRSHIVVRSTIDVGSGGESRPAAEEGGVHRHPAWTPDGASLRFFVWQVGTVPSWREVGKLGGTVRTIPSPWLENAVTWSVYSVLSPDGTRVVASRGDSIFAYTADTGEPELLGVHPVESSGQHSFTWSPDERLIAYADGAGGWRDVFQLAEASSSIWIMDADGGEPVRVTGGGSVGISPVWLDDDHLLFVSDRDGPREVYVVEVGPSGPRGEPRKVAGVTDAHTISYSVAGRKLAFSKATVRQNIWSYPIDSGTVSIADGYRVTSENAQIQAHDISPDGRWIVYSSDLRDNLDIYKKPVEGGNPRSIADSPSGGEIDPRWSPDGTEIAFHRDVGSEAAVMVVSADGGTPVQVASAEWTWLPSWSPSGLEFAFNLGQPGQMETWVVSRDAIGGPWGEATQLTDFGCELSDWAPDGSGVLCTVGYGIVPEADTSLVLVSREREVLWRYDPSTAGLVLTSLYQRFSRDALTIYARLRHEDGRFGIWAIPVQGGEPSLVVAYDDTGITAERWLSVGPDRLYLTVLQTEADIWVADVEVER